MGAIRKRYGALDCVVFPPTTGAPPRLCVVLCHGYGAPGSDLVPLGFELLARNDAFRDQVQLVFPAALLSMDEAGLYGGRAWWPINMQELLDSFANGDFRRLTVQEPPGLVRAREALLELLAEIQAETGLTTSQFVLGGFSQGAMLTTDITLHLPESTAGLCILSGTLICEPTWRELAPRRRGMHVFQSHGQTDTVLPLAGAMWLRQLLEEAGLHVDFLEFQGPHTIPPAALDHVAELISGALRS